jgi:hypothetical protein
VLYFNHRFGHRLIDCGWFLLSPLTTSSPGFHSFHELFEVFFCMTLRLFLGGLIQPFRLPFHTMLPVALPTAIICPVIRPVGVLINGFVLRVAVSPALGPVNTFALRKGRTLIVLLARLRPGTIEAVPSRSIRLFAVFVPRMRIGVAVAAIATVSIVPIPEPPVLATAHTVRPAHTAMEALGAFSAKALTWLHRTPTLAILVGVTASAEGTVCSAILKTVVGVIRLVCLVTEVESLRSVSGLDIPRGLLEVT